MARIYLASSWRNEAQPKAVTLLRNAGHLVYDFRNPENARPFRWTGIDLVHGRYVEAERFRTALLAYPTASHSFLSDARAMRWADICVMLLPCGRSAHVELGWMSGAGKQTFIVLDEEPEPELMYLFADHICLSIDEVIHTLHEQTPFVKGN